MKTALAGCAALLFLSGCIIKMDDDCDDDGMHHHHRRRDCEPRHDWGYYAPTPPPPTRPPTYRPPATPPEPSPFDTAAIRLRGVDANGFASVRLDLSALTVWVDGHAVSFEPGPSTLELADPDNAWLLARIPMPSSSSAVKVRLAFADEGHVLGSSVDSELQAKGAPIELSFPASSLQKRGHAVIHLDLAASIHDAGYGWVLLPNLGLYF